METEIEAKFVNIDAIKMRTNLSAQGAVLIHPELLMRRRNFDFPDRRLEAVQGWVRIRDEGEIVTLSYKQNNDTTIHGTVEVNVGVSSFESTSAFLEAIGMVQKSFQETRRETWQLNGVEITIDNWPWIPPFVEIEGPSEAAVKSVSGILGLKWADAYHGSVATVYKMLYNVTADEVNAWKEITFIPVPEWLEKTRRRSNEHTHYSQGSRSEEIVR